MPWPKLKVKFRNSFGSSPRTTYSEDEETGALIAKTVPCNEKLPDSENFEITNLIKAGVNLEEVNTKVIGKPFDESKIEEAITKIKNKQNNNNQKTDKE